jgi:hypothetical protein
MGKRDFKRKTESRRQNPRFLIVSEGAVTECEYLTALTKLLKIPSAKIMIAPPPPTSPKEIVKKARKLKKEARKDDPYDAVWCIFDVEAKVSQNARPGLADAVQIAKANKIFIALSNPCFELWILLHEKQHTATIYSDDVQHVCSSLGLVEGKHICNPNRILNNCQTAIQRAKDLDAMHQGNKTDKHEDQSPSSGVYKLVEAIYKAFPPRS